jgi:hypothetical protein
MAEQPRAQCGAVKIRGQKQRKNAMARYVAQPSAAWPLAARAQQGDRVRRIGVLMNSIATDSIRQSILAAFVQGLERTRASTFAGAQAMATSRAPTPRS